METGNVRETVVKQIVVHDVSKIEVRCSLKNEILTTKCERKKKKEEQCKRTYIIIILNNLELHTCEVRKSM